MSTEVKIAYAPACDLCGAEAAYDAKSKAGPWGYMCESCWRVHSVGKLGTGYGQRLIVTKEA
jgi:hypothetical protein